MFFLLVFDIKVLYLLKASVSHVFPLKAQFKEIKLKTGSELFLVFHTLSNCLDKSCEYEIKMQRLDLSLNLAFYDNILTLYLRTSTQFGSVFLPI